MEPSGAEILEPGEAKTGRYGPGARTVVEGCGKENVEMKHGP